MTEPNQPTSESKDEELVRRLPALLDEGRRLRREVEKRLEPLHQIPLEHRLMRLR